ncbi:MAG: response regulator [Candidatus Acidiferrales bacterium]
MATILIADDNSNIQKMVTLAFKDEGIEVVAVGNGEAAVRKAPEIMPDLVLADIFMPVRNGYEVCEFMKQDARLAHVPVVLLVGAFDPFDEREAQRVGADGVLKKPFVPPEPLVNLVKELLAKSAAEHLVPVSVTAALNASAQENNLIAAPAVAPVPVAPREIPEAPTAFDLPTETGPEEVRPFKAFTFREGPENSGKEGGASAFGSFMDTATDERDAKQELQSTQPQLDETETEDGPRKGYSGFSSWLSKTPALDSAAPPVAETQAQVPSRSADRISRAWHIAKTSETRPEDETVVEPLDRFAAEHFSGYHDEARKPEPEGVKAYDFETASVADATPEISGAIDAAAETHNFEAAESDAAPVETAVEAPGNAPSEGHAEEHFPPAQAFASQTSMDDTQTIDAIRSSGMPWHGVPSAIREMGHEAAEQPAEFAAEHLPAQHLPDQQGAATEESAKPFAEEWNAGSTDRPSTGASGVADATDYETPVYEAIGADREGLLNSPAVAESLSAAISSSTAETFAVPAPLAIDPRQLEEIITRVVERMQPQVLEVITREILRPVVEALVRRQLELK